MFRSSSLLMTNPEPHGECLEPMTTDGPAPKANVVCYTDPVEGWQGWLAVCGDGHRLAAGGLRMQPGVSESTVVHLAEAMWLKQRLLGLAVDGAKAGIDRDPGLPGKREALCRFLGFLRPHLMDGLSLGPDVNMTWTELEESARRVGIPSVKFAVARTQGLDEADFAARLRLLDADVAGATMAERRAGHALAAATLEAIEAAGVARQDVRIGIQGFGTLGRATAMSLTESGLTPTAVTDAHTCLNVHEEDGVTVADALPPQRLCDLPLDVLVLAACEDAISVERAARLDLSAVVVGANLGLAPAVEDLLHRRGVLVVPDFVGGCGGSASVDAIFGPPACPTPAQVLESLGRRVRALVREMFELSGDRGITPRQAALLMSQRKVPPGKPYGNFGRTTPASAGKQAAGGTTGCVPAGVRVTKDNV